MISARRLVKLQGFTSPRTRRLDAWLDSHSAANCFNPSAMEKDGRWYVALRHFGPERKKPFEASILQGTAEENRPRCTNLSTHAAAHGVTAVADPKLFGLCDQVWVTFNDGWSATENNLYVMQVTPELGRPVRCSYSHRMAVEKNWAFFQSEGLLKALYSIDPVRVLAAPLPDATACELAFSDYFPERAREGTLGLGIGTQICQAGDRGYLVAHERWHLALWRAYLGRWVEVEDLHGKPRITVSHKRLVASYRALLGSLRKHNPHLLSCTYFSGLNVMGDRALLSYGVNDIRGGFSEIEVDLL